MKKRKFINFSIIVFFILGLIRISYAASFLKDTKNHSFSQWTRIPTGDPIIGAAQVCFNGESFDQAIKYLEEFIGRKHKTPKELKILSYLGLASGYLEKGAKIDNAVEKNGYFDKAVFHFNKGLKLISKTDPLNISIYSGLGFVSLQFQDYNKAVSYLKKGLDYSIDDFPKEHTDILTNLGYSSLNLKKYKEAVGYFKEAMELSPGRPQLMPICSGLVSCYCHLQDFAQAADYLKKGFNSFLDGIQKENIGNYVSLDEIRLKLKDYSETIKYFCQIPDFAHEDSRLLLIYVRLIDSYEGIRDYVQDIYHKKSSADIMDYSKDDLTGIYINLGYAALSLKRNQEAIDYLGQSLKLSPEIYQIFPIYLGLLTCYREIKDYDKAKEFFSKGVYYFAGRDDLSYVLLSLKQYQEAAKFFSQALKISADDPLFLNLTNCYRDYGGYAGDFCLKNKSTCSAGEFKKDCINLYLAMGDFALAIKQYREAIVYFKRAIDLSPGSIQGRAIYFSVGTCYRELGDYDRAINYLDKSLNYALDREQNSNL